MKKTRIIAFITAAVILAVSLTSCSARLSFKNGKVYDSKNKISYEWVSSTWVPKSVSTELYATWKLNGVKLNYYAVEGEDPEKYLYSEVGDLIYSGTDSIPELDEFNANRVYICYTSDVTMSFDKITDAEVLSEIVTRYTTSELCEPNLINYNAYILLFESAEYENFYYSLRLIVTEDTMYVYNRFDGRYCEAADIFEDYVPAFYETDE